MPTDTTPLHLAIVCPAWNCERWVKRCLQSIKMQSYTNFSCVLIDDVSADGTFEAARAAVAGDSRFTILRNDTRQFPLANIKRATQLAAKSAHDVVIVVDGDDWLKHERVFERIVEIYRDPEVWLTYGSHELYRRPLRARLRRRVVRGTKRYPRAVEQSGLYRYCKFYAGHLRTYKKFLFDAIEDKDLRDDDGSYFWAAGDCAIGIPMLEMATARHIRYVDEILYVYNNNHPLAENRPENRDDKLLIKLKIAALPRYQPLLPEILNPTEAAAVK